MTGSHPPGTVAELIEFLGAAAERDDLNRATVQAMRSAWHSVTSELGISGATPVDTLQPDELVDKFEHLRPGFRSGATYRTRLRAGLRLFSAWLINSSWADPVWPRAAKRPRSLNSPKTGLTELRVLQFPVRRDALIAIEVPVDLTSSEAERIAAFLRSCVVPDDTVSGHEEAPAT